MKKKSPNPLGLKKKDFTVDTTKKTITADKDLYATHRPEEIDPEQEKLINEYKTNYVSSILAVGGEIAIDEMEKDEKANKYVINAGMSNRGRVKTSITRSRTYDIPDMTGSGKPKGSTTKYGTCSVSVSEDYGNVKRGQMRSTKDYIAELAKKRLS